MREMLQITDLTKVFNQGTINEKIALSHVDLTLNKGDFVTVIGGNGAGKSTMLNCIAGVFPVDDGKITIDGRDVTHMPEHKRAQYLGRVFQDPMMGTAADMRKTLAWGVTADERTQYRDLLAQLELGLENRLTDKVGLLSGGQRQALTLLMATLKAPKLLLLDEHTAALDPKTAEKVLNLTQKLVAEHHLTTLMVTHNMQDAIRLGNRLIMMNEGHIAVQIEAEKKQGLHKADLIALFEKASGDSLENDRLLLS